MSAKVGLHHSRLSDRATLSPRSGLRPKQGINCRNILIALIDRCVPLFRGGNERKPLIMTVILELARLVCVAT